MEWIRDKHRLMNLYKLHADVCLTFFIAWKCLLFPSRELFDRLAAGDPDGGHLTMDRPQSSPDRTENEVKREGGM